MPRNSLKRSLYKAIFEINHHKKWKFPPQVPEETSLQKNEGNILPKYIWRKLIHRTICEGKLSTKQALHKSIFQTNSKKNLYQRIFEETCLPNIAWNESLPTKYLKRNLSPEYFSNNFSTKICFKKWYRGSSEETFCKQKQCISTKKSL